MKISEIIKAFCDYLRNVKTEKEKEITDTVNNKSGLKYAESILKLIEEDKIIELYLNQQENGQSFDELLASIGIDSADLKEKLKNAGELLKSEHSSEEWYMAFFEKEFEDAQLAIEKLKSVLVTYVEKMRETAKNSTGSLTTEVDKISELLNCFANEELVSIIPDLDFFISRVIQAQSFGYINKNNIGGFLSYILDVSNKLHEEELRDYEEDLSEEIERNRKNIEKDFQSQMPIAQQDVEPVTQVVTEDKEQITQDINTQPDSETITDILEEPAEINPEIKKLDEIIASISTPGSSKLQRIVFEMFGLEEGFEKFDTATEDEISTCLQLMKEEAETLIKNQNMTAEEAIKHILNSHTNFIETLNVLNLFSPVEDKQYNEEDIFTTLKTARDFCHSTNVNISSEFKNKVKANIKNGLGKERRNKEYETYRLQKRDYLILGMAAYEMQVYIDLADMLDTSETDNKQVVLQNIAQRINEIMEAVITNVDEKSENLTQDEQKADRLFFIEKGGSTTYIEDDLQLDSPNKGISNSYYSDIYSLLMQIKTRNFTKKPIGINSQYQNSKNLGVLEARGSNTHIYFIPVTENAAIILGAYKNGNNRDTLDAIEDRISLESVQKSINEMIEMIKNNELSLQVDKKNAQTEQYIIYKLGSTKTNTDDEYSGGKGLH